MEISVIGCGNLGGSFIRGLVNAGVVEADQITASDPDEVKLEEIGKTGVKTTAENEKAARDSDAVFLAVKPGLVSDVLEEMNLSGDKLLVSLAAGVSTDYIDDFTQARIVRVMPNICGDVSEMASAFTLGPRATPEDGELVEDILSGLGKTVEVEEKHMNAVTGLSGSGPAYVFLFLEGLKRAGEELGLPEEVAFKLAAQTVKGSAELALESDKSLQDFVDMVCSPKGTTIEGVKILEEENLQETLEETVKAATKRAEELSR